MAQKEWLRNKVKIHVRDVNMTDSELDDIIDTVLNEISLETRVFKKLYGFTVHEDMEQYDFRYIARLNEQVEQEPGNITLGDPSPGDIIKFISEGTFPEILVNKNLEIETAQSQFIDLLDLFDEKGFSVLHRFEERGTSTYFCYNDEWRKQNDLKRFVMAAWVRPDIAELHDEDLSIILTTVIAGCKFYINDILHSVEDTQATNYDFMRWFQNKQRLADRFPTTVYSTKVDGKWL